jgi:aryl-alcohol dehydrogenase-like predicted oxidoreductase
MQNSSSIPTSSYARPPPHRAKAPDLAKSTSLAYAGIKEVQWEVIMKYRKLGSSGTVVSSLCLGTMTFGAEAEEATSHAMIADYAAAGGNFIDTADVYSKGISEEIIGRWFKANPTDARQMVLATKGRFPMGEGPNDLGVSRRHLDDALNASLRRLGVDRIDLYQMHAWDALTPIEETLRFLDDAVRAGKIAYYGFSNYLGWQVTKAVHVARAHGFTAPVTLQPQYNLLVRDIEHEIVPACLDAGMGLLPWSPLAGGWLAGKYKRDTPPTGATRLGENPKRGMEAYGPRNAEERTWQVIDAVTAIAKAKCASAAQVSLAWLQAQPAVTSVILGARTRDQLADNLGAADLEIDAKDIETLTEKSAPHMPDYPYGTAGIAQRHRKMEGGR